MKKEFSGQVDVVNHLSVCLKNKRAEGDAHKRSMQAKNSHITQLKKEINDGAKIVQEKDRELVKLRSELVSSEFLSENRGQ